jgi:tripartite-type tricarboxylate transporter receptor subunit TctC
MELFGHCKGLKLKHVPYKGGAESITAFLGRHTDFLQGTGSHIPYVRQGIARMLFVYTTHQRDPNFPDVPTLRELGCEDIEPAGLILIGPKGLPAGVVNKLKETFRKSSEGADFQNLLKQVNMPYAYKDGAQVEKDLPIEIEEYKRACKILGFKLKQG